MRRLLRDWPDGLAVIYGLVIATVGVVGLSGPPSEVFLKVVGPVNVDIYWLCMVMTGWMIAVSISVGLHRVELMALLGMSLLTLLNGLLTFAALGPDAWPTVVRFVGGAVGGISWAGTRWQMGVIRGELHRAVRPFMGRH